MNLWFRMNYLLFINLSHAHLLHLKIHTLFHTFYQLPLDPNLTVATRVVFPQSGRSRPKKTAVFPYLNLHICFKCLNFEVIWGNPGEILHIGWKILGSIWSKVRPLPHLIRTLHTPSPHLTHHTPLTHTHTFYTSHMHLLPLTHHMNTSHTLQFALIHTSHTSHTPYTHTSH